ncbi:hypothetical protein GEMRC1_014063 [Eukaryota sp. GEM-RC1]
MSKRDLYSLLQSLVNHLRTCSADDIFSQLSSILPTYLSSQQLFHLVSDRDSGIRRSAAALFVCLAPFDDTIQEYLYYTSSAIFTPHGWCVVSVPKNIRVLFENELKTQLGDPSVSNSLNSVECIDSRLDLPLFLDKLIGSQYYSPISTSSLFTFPLSSLSDVSQSFSYSFPDPSSHILAFRYSIVLKPPKALSEAQSPSPTTPCSAAFFTPAQPTFKTNSTLSSVRPSSLVSAIVHETFAKYPGAVSSYVSSSRLEKSSVKTPRELIDDDVSLEEAVFSDSMFQKKKATPRKSKIHELAAKTVRENVFRHQSGLYMNVLPLSKKPLNNQKKF